METPSVTVKETIPELQWLSDRISAQVRLIAAGILALAWGLLVSPPATLTLAISQRGLVFVAVLALLAMVVDLGQYLAAYVNAKAVHMQALRDGGVPGFNVAAPGWRKMRTFCFWAKQAIVGGAFATLLAVVIPPLLGRL